MVNMVNVRDHLGWAVAGAALALAVSVMARGGAEAPALATVANGMSVACEPTQRALIFSDATGAQHVRCTSVAPMMTQYGSEAAALTPASYVLPAAPVTPVVAQPVRQAAAAPVRAARPASRSSSASRTSEERSWQKRALVIGGTAGAGAGIGALIGGKKGALIGAAIGGGSGTAWELIKHGPGDDR